MNDGIDWEAEAPTLQAFFNRLCAYEGKDEAVATIMDLRKARLEGACAKWDGNIDNLEPEDRLDTLKALAHLWGQMNKAGYKDVTDPLALPPTASNHIQ